MIFETYHYKKNRVASARQNPLCTLKENGGSASMRISTGNRSIDGWVVGQFDFSLAWCLLYFNLLKIGRTIDKKNQV
jgi:hypothetical protein